MTRRFPSEQEQALAERLRREASETSPPFSEKLHRRICLAAKQGGPQTRLDEVSVPSFRRWAIATAISIGLLSASWVVWQTTHPSAETPNNNLIVEDATDPLEEVNGVIDIADEAPEQLLLAGSELLTEQLAYLQHDARIAAALITDPLSLDLSQWTDEH